MMFKKLVIVVVLCFSPLAVAQGLVDPPPASGASVELARHVPHLAEPADGLVTSGQPDKEAWELLAAQGVTTVINLRSDEEMRGSDEAGQVAAASMHYVHIPVAGGGDVNRANAARLHEAVASAPGKVLVHCASGNRVGALLAIDASDRRQLDVDQAVAYGKSAGLTGLEPRVREVLTTSSPEDSPSR